MASTIRIKRSSVNGNPTYLAAGELAYSAQAGTQSNGGDRLYIGIGSESGTLAAGTANAANHYVVGGKYFTDMLDHVAGTLTASSALIADANSKIDIINVGNIRVTGSSNVISSTDTNGNIVLTPNGTGYVSISGTNGVIIPVGTTGQRAPAIQGAIRFNTTTSQFEGYSGSNWASMGGVRSVDGLTYIAAEDTPGASDDIIHFYASNNSTAIEVAKLNTTKLELLQTTAASSNTTGALVVAGGVGIGGNLYIGGNLVLTGTENVFDNVTLQKNTTIVGSDTAATEYFKIQNGSGVDKFVVDSSTGNTVIQGTLNVTGTVVYAALGATSITDSGLTSGRVTYASTGGLLVDSNNMTFNGTTLTVNTLAVTNNISSVGGTLSVTGDTALTGNLSVAATINANGGTIGTTAVSFNLLQSNAATIGAFGAATSLTMGYSGVSASTTNLATGNVASATTKTINIGTGGQSGSTTNVNIGSVGVATGTTTINTAVSVAQTLSVSGHTTFEGVTSTGSTGTGNLVYSVGPTFTGTLNAAAITTTGNVIVGGTLAATGATTLSSTLAVTGDFSVATNKFTVAASSGNAAVAGTLAVTGAATLTSTLAVNSITDSTTTTTGALTVAGGVGIAKKLVVGDTASVAGDFAVATNKFTVAASSGNTTVAGTLAVTGVATYSANIAMSGYAITGLANPTNAQDAATKAYVDAARNGLDIKQSVRAATTANITLSNTQTIDGVALAAGDRILVKDQTTASQNGLYEVVSGAAWTRTTDANNIADAGGTTGEFTAGLFCFVEEGTVNGDSGFVCTNDGVITLGSTAITFAQFSGAGQVIAGAGLTKTGNQIDVGAGNGITVNANDVALATTVAGNGLTYTTGVLDVVGTTNRISVSSDSIDISSSYVGQASIVTVGTLTTGALGVGFTTVNVAQGGTGVASFTSNGVLYGNGTSAVQATAVATIAGSYLRQDASGAPFWSAEVDGGTY